MRNLYEIMRSAAGNDCGENETVLKNSMRILCVIV